MMPTFSREEEMSPVVSQWLDDQGLEVCAEVAGTDIVGFDVATPRIITVELKLGFTRKLFYQARLSGYNAHQAYAAAPSRVTPKVLERAAIYEVGLLRVFSNAVVVIRPAPVRELRPSCLSRMLERLRTHPRNGVGGKPCIKGEGPAKTVARLVREYIVEHPSADWTEIYENVPNHYANMKSMRGTMNNWHGISLTGPKAT